MKLATILAAFLGMAGGAWAQSLLGENPTRSPIDPPQRPPYRKHDHVTVMVLERSRALSSAELKTDRRSRWEVSLDEFIRFNRPSTTEAPRLKAAALAGDPGIDMDARFRQDNNGRTTRQFDLAVTITAEIVDVRPNGTLVIQAMKRRRVNSDDEVIRLTGEIASTAITNNMVRSDNIANLSLAYEGSGSVSDSGKPGWLGWLLSKLWPF